MELTTIIRPEHSFIGLQATTKWRALEVIASKAANAFSVESASLLRALESRENLGSTGCGSGIAIPHAAIEGMSSPQGILVRFGHPLDFQAVDDQAVDIAVLLIFGEAWRGEYLNALASIARQLRSEDVLRAMRAARTADELYASFVRQDG